MSPRRVEEIVLELERLYADLALGSVKAWKAADPGRRAVGSLPVYAPREVLWAAGALPVFVRGGGDAIETIRGDAYYQSYICHLPRSVLELGLGGWLDALDGMLFPNTCDVIRNLSGIWATSFPGKLVRFLDPPQSYAPGTAAAWWRHELERLYKDVCALSGRTPNDAALASAIREYAAVRAALVGLARARKATPWLVPADEAYLLRRAGDLTPPGEYVALVHEYLEAARGRSARREDRIKVVVRGAFCEQPPLGLIRAVEKAGCYVIDDDLLVGLDAPVSEVAEGGDPLAALARAYVADGGAIAIRYDEHARRGPELVAQVKALGADGVVFMAASFCDPALLDQPRVTQALDDAHVPYAAFKYAENTGQFQGIHEQAGTFADSVKLWGEA